MQLQNLADSSLCRQSISIAVRKGDIPLFWFAIAIWVPSLEKRNVPFSLLIFAVMMLSEREGTRWFVSTITTIIAARAIETPEGCAFPFFATC
jgi:hypothetical protein